jgi:hypothetical protein
MCAARDTNETDVYERVLTQHYGGTDHTVVYMLGAKFAGILSRL